MTSVGGRPPADGLERHHAPQRCPRSPRAHSDLATPTPLQPRRKRRPPTPTTTPSRHRPHAPNADHSARTTKPLATSNPVCQARHHTARETTNSLPTVPGRIPTPLTKPPCTSTYPPPSHPLTSLLPTHLPTAGYLPIYLPTHSPTYRFTRCFPHRLTNAATLHTYLRLHRPTRTAPASQQCRT